MEKLLVFVIKDTVANFVKKKWTLVTKPQILAKMEELVNRKVLSLKSKKFFCICKTLKREWTLLTSWLSGFEILNDTNMIMPSYDDEIDRDKFLWLNKEFKTKTLKTKTLKTKT